MLQERLLKNSGTMGKWVVDYITAVSSLISQITAYKDKTSDYNCKLTVNFYLSYLRLITTTMHDRGGSRTAATSKVELFVIIVNGWKQHHAELANLSTAKPQAFSDLKTFGLGGKIWSIKSQSIERSKLVVVLCEVGTTFLLTLRMISS